jgi:hypothetical protein
MSFETFPLAVCRLGTRLAEALAFAHGKGVLHCDIKPANILMTPYGRPMLVDFNVAFDRARTRGVEGIGGTLAYTAPEHTAALHGILGGRVDERSDIYSLGVVLQELGTGTRPEPCDPLRKHPASPTSTVPDALDRLPRELAVVVRRSLHPDPNERYQSAADLARALAGAAQLLTARRTMPPAGRIGTWVTAHPVAALALAGCPHLVASVVNIAYNAVEIQLNEKQKNVFAVLVMIYNVLAYPAIITVIGLYLLRLKRGLAAEQARRIPVEVVRVSVRRWGWLTMVLGAVGWFPGAVVFPLAIDLAAGPLPWEVYAHFAISFTLSGLIGVVFCFLATEYVVFRALLPRLGDPDCDSCGQIGAEFKPLTALFSPCLVLACAVPLAGAVLLIFSEHGVLTLGFRLLVAGLIGLGVAGVWFAERLTRELRSLAVAWQEETRDDR